MILAGNFNIEINETFLQLFCESYELKSLIKEPTCYKNPANPSCIDLIMTNNPLNSPNLHLIETGLSEFYKITITVMITIFAKLKPNVVN